MTRSPHSLVSFLTLFSFSFVILSNLVNFSLAHSLDELDGPSALAIEETDLQVTARAARDAWTQLKECESLQSCSEDLVASYTENRLNALHELLRAGPAGREIFLTLPSYGMAPLDNPVASSTAFVEAAVTIRQLHAISLGEEYENNDNVLLIHNLPSAYRTQDNTFDVVYGVYVPKTAKYLRSVFCLTKLVPKPKSSGRSTLEVNFPEHARGEATVLVLRIKATRDSLPPIDLAAMQQSLAMVKDFVARSSGGAQTLKFIVPEAPQLATSYCCDMRLCGYPDVFKIYDEFAAKYASTPYQRMALMLPNCDGFPLAGLAEINGNRVWIRGYGSNLSPVNVPNLAAILAHEIMHTNGAYHSEMDDNAYGNPYSLMGAGQNLLGGGENEVAAKSVFGWFPSPTQIRELGVQGEHPNAKERLQRGVATSFIDTWIYAHDVLRAGEAYQAGRTYGVKIHLKDAGEFLWVETRSLWGSALSGKALLSWAPEFRLGADQDATQTFLGNTVGPTHLVDSRPHTDRTLPGDEALEVGKTWVYEPGRSGVSVSVLGARDIGTKNEAVRVKIQFTSNDVVSRLVQSAPTLACGGTYTLPAGAATSPVIRLVMPYQGRVWLKNTAARNACDGSDINVADGIATTYPWYPLALVNQANGVVAAGADLALGAETLFPLCKRSGAVTGQFLRASTNVYGQEYRSFDPNRAGFIVVQRGSYVGAITIQADCTTVACAAGSWMNSATRSCVSCPSHLPESPVGATSAAQCYKACDSLVVTRPNGANTVGTGLYTRVKDATMYGQDYFASDRGTLLVRPIPLSGIDAQGWNVVSAANIGSVLEMLRLPAGLAKARHPSQLGLNAPGQLGAYNLQCACESANTYLDAAGNCVACPAATPNSAPGAIGVASCFKACSPGSGVKITRASNAAWVNGVFDKTSETGYASRALGLDLVLDNGVWRVSRAADRVVMATSPSLPGKPTGDAPRAFSVFDKFNLGFACEIFAESGAGSPPLTLAPTTKAPTPVPTTRAPTTPTSTPTKKPTKTPTMNPTKKPSKAPTKRPTKAPTMTPTKRPTKAPTMRPTKKPTPAPTRKATPSPVVVVTPPPNASAVRCPTGAEKAWCKKLLKQKAKCNKQAACGWCNGKCQAGPICAKGTYAGCP